MTDKADTGVIIGEDGRLGRIIINRPQALNALTLPIVRAMRSALDRWAADNRIVAVAVDSAGERGLCAGGDIREIHASIAANDGMAQEFWKHEYMLNAFIAAFPKPYVVLMDGLVMGGGVGISAHGSHRLATERLRLAMPEVGIGFFPDVGGTWLLAHAPGQFGTYLALTGAMIGAADAILAGLADVAIKRDDWKALLARLRAADSAAEVDALVAAANSATGESRLQPHFAEMNEFLGLSRMERIVETLRGSTTAFAAQTLRQLEAKSPMSLKVTLAALRRAATLPALEDALAMELHMGRIMSHRPDFLEGIRAVVIDKDQKPRWSPAKLEDVDDAEVSRLVLGIAEKTI